MTDAGKQYLQATCVAFNGRAAVITGVSGSGKSTLALQMIAQGAELVSDDGIHVTVEGNAIIATAPRAMRGKLEVRGVGIINVAHRVTAPVAFIVDMDKDETERLPPFRIIELLGQKAPLYHRVKGDHFAVALTQILKNGRSD